MKKLVCLLLALSFCFSAVLVRTALADSFWDRLRSFGDTISDAYDDVIDWAEGAFNDVKGFIDDHSEDMKSWLELTEGLLSDTFKYASDKVKKAWDILKEAAFGRNFTAEELNEAYQTVYEWLYETASSGDSKAARAAQKALEALDILIGEKLRESAGQ